MRRVTTGETATGTRPARAAGGAPAEAAAAAAGAPAEASPPAGADPPAPAEAASPAEAPAEAPVDGAPTSGAAAADPGPAEAAAGVPPAAEPAWRISLDAATTDWEIPEQGGEIVPLAEARATVPIDPDAAPEAPARPAGHTLCLHCFGSGQVSTPALCPACGGAGGEWCEGMSMVCPVCHGTRRVNVPCGHCSGTGWTRAAAAGSGVEQPPATEAEAEPGASRPDARPGAAPGHE